ncbi:uncharacterized protein [Lolium perenne]|uniref:uncharacterized protein n=1 Tax=Lolium perenne TaxID=4522 RepID=UPI0021F61FFC|nr:uncharacterized protein LOC127338994 [Lolium perenne]
MDSSPGWLKRALIIFFFGVKAIIFGMVAENKLPVFGKSIITGEDDDSMVMCELPRLSVAMGSLSVLSLLLTVLAGHFAVLYPYTGKKKTAHQPEIPRRALFRKTSLTIFFVMAELVSASALAMLFWATITEHANLRYMPTMLPDGTLSCPSTAKTDGMFGGGALLALDATLMWFVCLLMSLEARANYLDLHGGVQDDIDDGSKKKLDLHGDHDINNNGNNKKLDLHQDDDIEDSN